MSKASKRTPAQVGSTSAAAAATGLPAEVIREARESGCPAFDASGRVKIQPLLDWLEEHPEVLEAAGSKVDAKHEEALIKRNKRIQSDLDLAERQKKLLPADKVAHDTFRMFTELKNGILGAVKTGTQSAALDAGLNPDQANTVFIAVENEILSAMETFSRGGSE